MELEGKHYAAGGGLLAAALLLLDGRGLPTDLAEAQERLEENTGSVIDRVQEVSQDGELVIDPVTGVFYDDPEEGPMDDEEEDDRNLSFEAVNNALAEFGEYIDPTTYAPDTEGDTVAPDWGVLPDAGDSQVYGDASEAENDDVTERVADSNMTEEEIAMWDRLANRDSAEEWANDYEEEEEEEDDSSSSSSSGSSSSGSYSGGSSSSSSGDQFGGGLLDGGSEDVDDNDTINYSDSTSDDVDGDPFSGGLVA